jgi:hypothetical protein
MAVTKFQVLSNDLLKKHKASLLLYVEICHLFKEYISSPNFDRFAKFKNRRSHSLLHRKHLIPRHSDVLMALPDYTIIHL